MIKINYLNILKTKYAKFNDRATRSEYWYFILVNTILSIIFSIIGVIINSDIFGNIFSLIIIIPTIAVGVRRMHDVGKSGWFLIIPIYNFILTVTDSEKKDNKYGEYNEFSII